MPGSFTVVSPTVIASEATTKNQPPDIDIMVFQIRPGAAKGTSSRQKRSHGESWKWRLTSSRSCGIVRDDWEKLNALLQARAANIANIAAHCAPRCLRGNRLIQRIPAKT